MRVKMLYLCVATGLMLTLASGCSEDMTPVQTGGDPQAVNNVQSPEDLVQLLAQAYRDRDPELFDCLLADDYLFITDPAAGEDQWGYDEESRIHQRMFDPENVPPGQNPVPTEFHLTSITITLTRTTPFTERNDLYVSPSNPTGLDPTMWRASDALYSTDVLFDTQGDLDFQVTARANFVIIEDLQKTLGDEKKFLLLQWNDLPAKPSVGKEAI